MTNLSIWPTNTISNCARAYSPTNRAKYSNRSRYSKAQLTICWEQSPISISRLSWYKRISVLMRTLISSPKLLRLSTRGWRLDKIIKCIIIEHCFNFIWDWMPKQLMTLIKLWRNQRKMLPSFSIFEVSFSSNKGTTRVRCLNFRHAYPSTTNSMTHTCKEQR